MRLPMLILLCLCWLPSAGATQDKVWLLDVRGAIGVATMEYVVSGIDAAHDADGHLTILRIDTPGGLDNAMRQIIQRILSSNIPIVVYVSPQGARAASAGTYILYAAHIAAMSPATTLGAATPVQLGGIQAPTKPTEPRDDKAPTPATAMERKIINDAVAYIEGLADLRGRNRQWAAQAVRSAASLSANDALSQQVVDIVASDIDDLLQKLEGRSVSVNGQDVILASVNVDVVTYSASWRHEFLSIVTNPNIAYILLLAGAYGLFFEFSNPGMGVPGIIGALCILIALYAFQLLPINYAGAGIILLGLGLMAAEAMMPSFGIFGIGGIIAFVIGSIILMDTAEPAFQIATPLIVAVAIGSAGFIFLTIGMLLKNRRRKPVSGIETLVGQTALVEALHGHHPMVRLDGELWQVEGDTPLQPGDQVSVLSMDGLTLTVRKQPPESYDG
jgi:membrane-bound serine protease (ClpP class)